MFRDRLPGQIPGVVESLQSSALLHSGRVSEVLGFRVGLAVGVREFGGKYGNCVVDMARAEEEEADWH